LQSVLKQALLQATGTVLLPDFLPTAIRHPEKAAEHAASTGGGDWEAFIQDRLREGSQELYAETLALMERQLVTAVLRHTQGNQVQAARILGITRGSLRTKIRSLGITIERAIWSDDNQPE